MADKTEAPTPHRLQEARAEGQVVRSQELNTAVIILVGAFLLRGPGTQLGKAFKDMMVMTITELSHVEVSTEWVREIAFSFSREIFPSFALLLVGLLFTGVGITLGQTQFLWAGKKIGFDAKRLNPLEGFKRIFSKHGLIELLRSLLKLGLVSWVAYGFLRSNSDQLILLTQYDLNTSISKFIGLALALTIRVGGMYLILAVADYAYQRWDLYKNLRMSKEEIKEENKRSEGDPMLKSRVRGMQRQMARGRMMANVPKATVVITNPTHLAVAIEYQDGMKAPRVLAKGPYRVAERIVKIAKEHHIPVLQNIPLARALYKTIEIGQEISPDLYLAVAEVLAYVYKLRGKVSSGRRESEAQQTTVGMNE
jgi:flagellar biosynthetic protein FlhB